MILFPTFFATLFAQLRGLRIMPPVIRIVSVVLMLLPASVHAVSAADVSQVRADIMKVDPDAGILVEHLGETLLSLNADAPRIPASLMKVPLSMSALALLDKRFRFATDFYTDRDNNLLIRGRGDPLLTSEEWMCIADNLLLNRNKRRLQFNQLYLDNTLFEEKLELPGRGDSDNPYDALIHALYVNFNTLNIRLSNLSKRKDKRVVSAEEATPTLPLMQSYANKLTCCGKAQRIQIGDKQETSNQYTAELVRHIFAAKNISFAKPNGYQMTKVTSRKWQLLYRHQNSHTLNKTLKKMLYFSTNTIAHALLMQFSVTKRNKPTLQDALARWQRHLKKLRPAIPPLKLYEGSGLDRNNKMSAETMMILLQHFEPFKDLLRYYKNVDARYKTGSLQGVSNAAGFLQDGKAFVLFTDSDNKRNKIIKILTRLAPATNSPQAQTKNGNGNGNDNDKDKDSLTAACRILNK